VVGGLVSEIDSYIDKIKAEMGDLTVIFTGGDCKFLASRVSHRVKVVDNLLSIGLNRILSYNENI
jgi:pantothenate kinase type III